MYPDAKDEVVQLYLDDIIPNRFQPREIFDEKALKELAVSIKEHGVIQPIIVRNVNGKYEIIAGERRYKASALAGMTKIPAIIRDLDDKESSKVALLENLQRKNLNPIEEARTYQKILEIDQMTQEELARTMGKSQSAVANKIRLLSLPEEVQDALLKEQISERHARSLLNIPDSVKQNEMLKKVIDSKMSVRSLEEEIKKMYPKENSEIDKKDEENSQEIIASANAFVNSQPLMPTAELPEDTSNYGKVTIAPPIEGGESSNNQFINYGEISKEDSEESDEETDDSMGLLPTSTTVDMDQARAMAQDINNNESKDKPADLDSLLNIGNINSASNKDTFINPTESITKMDSSNEIDKKESSDYFTIPEIPTMNLPSSIINPANAEDNNIFLTSTLNNSLPKKYTIEDATKKIRDLIEELKQNGININTDEMNFDKSYQIIIKIDKTTENE